MALQAVQPTTCVVLLVGGGSYIVSLGWVWHASVGALRVILDPQ